MPDPLNDLYEPLERAAATGAHRDVASDVLDYIAEAGGVVFAADLLAAGHPPAVVAALAQSGPDKRVRPRLALGVVAGHRLCWLRSSGWQAVGQPNRRECPPTERSLAHRLAAPNFERTIITHVVPPARASSVLVSVLRDKPLRDYVEERKGDAWAVVKAAGADAATAAGRVLGGVYPDVLVVENWPSDLYATRSGTWPSVGGDQGVVDDASDLLVAIEVELSGKATPVLAAKVAQHDTAMALGWWHAVCWVSDDADTLTRLQRAGITRPEHPGHYALLSSTCHLGPVVSGLALPTGARVPWWAGRFAITTC